MPKRPNLAKSQTDDQCRAMRCTAKYNRFNEDAKAWLCTKHHLMWDADGAEVVVTSETLGPATTESFMVSSNTHLDLRVEYPENQLFAAQQEAESTRTSLVGFEIHDQEEFDMLDVIRKEATTDYKTLEDQRLALTKPLDKAKRDVMDWFRPAKDALTELKSMLKTAADTYVNEQERKRLQLMQENKHAEALAVEQPAMPAGTHTRTVWHYEISNKAIVPQDYRCLDLKKIEGEVQRLKGNTQIPGVRVWSEQSTQQHRAAVAK